MNDARRVQRLDADTEADFLAIHCERQGMGWCACVAWWVPTWEGWGERTSGQNFALRRELWARGEHDGYLAYVGDEPVAWCQAGKRDRLPKLVQQFDLKPDPEAWAITCFAVAPGHRRKGLARYLLGEVLADLRARGVRRVEAFPKRGEGPQTLSAGDLWTGPEAIYTAAGFSVASDDPSRPILRLELAAR